MRRFINLVGRRFGRLKVLSLYEVRNKKYAIWNCQCDCGSEIVAWGQRLRGGQQVSCGCNNSPIQRKQYYERRNPVESKLEKTLLYLQGFSSAHGFPPTIEEIRVGCDIKSKSTVAYYLDKLTARGLIQKDEHRARTITLTEEGRFKCLNSGQSL